MDVTLCRSRMLWGKTLLGGMFLLLVGAGAAANQMISGADLSPDGSVQSAQVPSDWWSRARRDIAEREYQVTWQDKTCLPEIDSAWHAPNRAHDLRTYFTEHGPRVVRRSEAEPTWVWGLELSHLSGVGVPPVDETVANGNRIEFRRGNFIEWYVNDARGLEQGFTIEKIPLTPLNKGGEITLDLAVRGELIPGVMPDGETVEFLSEGGVGLIHYGQLRAWDAAGRDLPARMELVKCGGLPPLTKTEASLRNPKLIRLTVDASEAVYPVTIDPLATSASWTAEINQSEAWFGCSVATAGDVNADGYSDVIIGAYGYDHGQNLEGGAFVYLGSESGLSAGVHWSAESDRNSAFFGYSVATAGDVNGDGYSDVIVGAPGYTNGQNDEGAAYVYLGSASGLSPTAAWTVESDQEAAQLGYSVATAGDVNGDGYSDIIVAVPMDPNDQTDEGRVFLYLGSESALSPAPDWTAQGAQEDPWFVQSVATAGDVNSDGYADIIVGAMISPTRVGRVFVWHGSASGLGPDGTPLNADWIGGSEYELIAFGESVGTAGDVNGDGYSDAIVGSTVYSNGQTSEGGAFVYYGSDSGLSTSAVWMAEGDQEGAAFGYSVATAGDINGDGYADVIVGANAYDNGETNEGRAYVFLGSASGLSPAPVWTAESDQAWVNFGRSVSAAGDVNGDGYSDVIVGAWTYSNPEFYEGRAYVYHGSASGLSAGSKWQAESNQADAWYGFSVSTAGDVNGDGYSDVIVGAVFYDNGETDEGRAYVYHGSASGLSSLPDWIAESNQAFARLGNCVSTAGDVNGDGYSDVIVGAYYYDNEENNEGRAYVYHGSASGLSGEPEWTAESNQGNAQLGFYVSAAGDVNGDGYFDVLIGAPGYDNGESDEGRAYVYFGSDLGLSPSADWTGEINRAGAQFGRSVAAAGDVNGDGYGDVIVGAPYYTDGETEEGGVFVYHGSASGLSSQADWTAEGGQAQSRYGYVVSTAGDVNRDGYSDVIVGAYGYDNGQDNEGRAFVYHGSSTGLSTSANWTAESDQEGAGFGGSVSTAGDVNGDGYSDVIVGAYGYDHGETDEGGAFIYHGSVSGLSVAPDWSAESDQASANFGSVSTAGDVNGDGYSDVIIGASWYDNGENDEGRVFVYYGNGEAEGGRDVLATTAAWTAESDQELSYFCRSIGTAGDVNGDGYSDIIVGADRYDNGQSDEGQAFVYLGSAAGLSATAAWTAESDQSSAHFGYSVATAGDVNGDGYSDIIVGAPDYEFDTFNQGAAFVWYGSSSGLVPNGAPSNADWIGQDGEFASDFGESVATAGDVNGDGYSDVIIGADNFVNDQGVEGRASVYLGSVSGLSGGPAWIAESDQGDSWFGHSVATAGDVNGDGYSDVIVGAPRFDSGQTEEGRAFIWYGSASGLGATGHPSNADWSSEGNQANAWFGRVVASAGDVNADGFSDAIVGAPQYTHGEASEGRVFVYHGSSSGLSSSAAWMAESNQAYAVFGECVSTAGDVNGDGYSDVIVGAPLFDDGQFDSGRAFVYLSSPTGLAMAPTWVTESDQGGAHFGQSVATAGDINGDGCSDVIVGALFYASGQDNEGRAYAYYGVGTRGGFAMEPMQMRTDDSVPVQPLCSSDDDGSILLSLRGRSPFGRGKVKLEVECVPLGTPLIGAATSVSPDWSDPDGGRLAQLVTGLSPNTVYHWRARLLYHPVTTPLQQHSRWFTPCWNGPEEGDFRTAAALLEIDWRSLFEFAHHWNETDYSGWCDFSGDGTVDNPDLLDLERRWHQ